jgi:hypothetical protein
MIKGHARSVGFSSARESRPARLCLGWLAGRIK